MNEAWRRRCAGTLRRCRALGRRLGPHPGSSAGREWRLQAAALAERSAELAVALGEAEACDGRLPLELESRLGRAEHAARVSECQVRRLLGEAAGFQNTERRKEDVDTTGHRH